MGIETIINNANIDYWALRAFVAIALILFGIFIGKILAKSLKKLSIKLEIQKKIRGSFVDLFLVIIKWSIYILFINLALNQLGIPALSNFLTNILIVIPAFTGALVLIAGGFALAVYLREVIEDSEVTGWKMISLIMFYFIIYISLVYALKAALISLDAVISNYAIVGLTIIFGIATAYYTVKKELKKD